MLHPGLHPLELFFEKKKYQKNLKIPIEKKKLTFDLISLKRKLKFKIIKLDYINFLRPPRTFLSSTYLQTLVFKKIFKEKGFIVFQSSMGFLVYFLNSGINIEILNSHLNLVIKNNFFEKEPGKKVLVIFKGFDILGKFQQKKIKRLFLKTRMKAKFVIILLGQDKKFYGEKNFPKSNILLKSHRRDDSKFLEFLEKIRNSESLYRQPFLESIDTPGNKSPRKKKNFNMWSFLSKKKNKPNWFFKSNERFIFFLLASSKITHGQELNFPESLIEKGGGKEVFNLVLWGPLKFNWRPTFEILKKWNRIDYLALLKTRIFLNQSLV